MTSTYRIVESTPDHPRLLAMSLRDDDRLEITSLNGKPLRVVYRSFRASLLRRTAFVDGDIAAMWGLGGSFLSGDGEPWLFTTYAVERMPLAFVREARAEISQMFHVKQRLSNFVLASYVRSIRMLEMIGFTIGYPQPFGPNETAFCPFSMERPWARS